MPGTVAWSGNWTPLERSMSGVFATEAKMRDEDKFEGAKAYLEASYVWRSRQLEVAENRLCCALPSRPTLVLGQFEGAVHAGLEGSGWEYTRVEFTPYAKLWEPGAESETDWRATRDLLNVGTVRYIKDEPLEVDSYLEIALGRAGRQIVYRKSETSPHLITFGVQASLGWARAETENDAYSTVSNPFGGLYLDASYDHDRWGGIYATGRFVNGFSFSNPSRGHPTAREAAVQSGYRKALSERLLLRIFWEKRSFYFDEGDLPDFYTWTRSYAAAITWRFD